MRFPDVYRVRNANPTGIQGISGAAPVTIAGIALDAGYVGGTAPPGARVYAKVTTSGLALVAKWQVLDDNGTTWIDVVESNNPANVAFLTGTGSAASVVKILTAPMAAAAGSRSARVVVVSSGASGAGVGTDECSISYEFRQPASYTGT
jgi:hypothetical protein